MVTKLFLRPHSLPLSTLPSKILFPKIPSLPRKLLIFSLSLSLSTAAQPQISDPKNSSSFYGPSLRKGTTNPKSIPQSHPPSQRQDSEQEEENLNLIDEESFSRVFDIAALRVPAKDCFALESRLRGHLLNWPRIRNIARVPGDEVEDDVVELLANPNREIDGDEENGLVSLNRRMYGKSEGDGEPLSPVLYREKLAKTFDSRGYVKFRNLARMSRPNQRKKRREGEGEGGRGEKGLGRNEFSVLEVVEDEDEEEGGDLKGLLGDEFEGRRKWRGSTRLLLLDERFASSGVEQLPEAIKVLFSITIALLLSNK